MLVTNIRILVFAMMMLVPLVANAQDDPATKARVSDVRDSYKKALADINAVQKDEDIPKNDALISLRLIRPDSGPSMETLEFYAELKEDSVKGAQNEAFFIRRNYNVDTRNYYNEFLFDRTTGDLIFAYVRSSNEDAPNIKVEDRYYFTNGSLVPIWHTTTGIDTEKNVTISQKQIDEYKWKDEESFFNVVPENLRMAFRLLGNNQ